MIRLISIACIALWLAGCAGQTTNTTAQTDAAPKSCDQSYRATASNEAHECNGKECPMHKPEGGAAKKAKKKK